MRTSWLVGMGFLVSAGCSAKPATETPQEPLAKDDAMAAPTPTPVVSGWKGQLAQVDKLVYHFQDSSVPPPDHRSFTITVTSSQIDKVVDSYGDIISEQGNALSPEGLKGLLATMEGLGIDVTDNARDENGGCTGGTSDSLSLFAGNVEVLSGRVSSCGGGKSGVLVGDVKQLARNATQLLTPNTDAPSPE